MTLLALAVAAVLLVVRGPAAPEPSGDAVPAAHVTDDSATPSADAPAPSGRIHVTDDTAAATPRDTPPDTLDDEPVPTAHDVRIELPVGLGVADGTTVLVRLIRRGVSGTFDETAVDDDLLELPASGGVVVVPQVGRGIVGVRVRIGERTFAADAGARADLGDVVRLTDRETVAVRVRGADGRVLLGVPVELCAVNESSRSRVGDTVATTAAPDGLAHLPWPPAMRSARLGTTTYCVRIAAPTPTSVEAALPERYEAGRVIELTAPPAATLRVDLVDRSGAAVRAPWQVHVTSRLLVGGQGPALGGSTWSVDGTATFALVGAGVPLRVVASGGAQFLPAALDLEPLAAGERAHVRLEVGARRVVVAGRLVDVGGNAVDGSVQVELVPLQAQGSAATFRDDREHEQGEFEVALGGDEPPLPALLRIVARADPRGDDPHAAPRSASFERRFDAWPRGRRIELGDVRVDVEPLVVAGRIVGPGETPPTQGSLRVQVRGADGTWALSDRIVYVAKDGTFRLFGAAPEGELRLVWISTLGNALPDEGTPFTVGASDVLVRVAPTEGRVAVSFRVPSGVATLVPRVLVRPADDEDAPQRRVSALQFSSGVYDVPLAPGAWTIEVGVEGVEEVLARAAAVVVREGERVEPRELASIDLLALMRLASVRVVDAAGNPLAEAALWQRPAAAERTATSTWIEVRRDGEGRFRVAVPRWSAVDVLVTARGHAWVERRGLRTDEDVTVPTARPRVLRVRLGAGLPAARETDRYDVSPVYVADGASALECLTDPRSRIGSATLAPGGAARFDVPAEGRYAARLTLTRANAGGGGAFGVGVGGVRAYGEALLTEEITEAELVVEPATEELDAARARLDADPRGK